MRNLAKYFENKKINYNKLLELGFINKNKIYLYNKNILDNHFQIIIEISKEKQTSKIIDLTTNEEYILVDVLDSKGNYVGKIKEIY